MGQADLWLRPPTRQRMAGTAATTAGLVGIVVITLAIALGGMPAFGAWLLVIASCYIAAGWALLRPSVRKRGPVVVIQNAWRAVVCADDEITGIELVESRAPWALALAIGWPFPKYLGETTAVFVLRDGRRVAADATRSVRIPGLDHLATSDREDTEAMLSALREALRNET